MIRSAKEAVDVKNLKHENCQDYRQMEARGYLACLEGPEVKALVAELEEARGTVVSMRHKYDEGGYTRMAKEKELELKSIDLTLAQYRMKLFEKIILTLIAVAEVPILFYLVINLWS